MYAAFGFGGTVAGTLLARKGRLLLRFESGELVPASSWFVRWLWC